MADIVDTRTDPEAALARATEALGRGVPVAIPTETVYGLSADATNPQAIARIYEMKGRPRFNPLICHMADLAMAERHAVFDPLSRRIAEAFWPGPLTLVLPIRSESPIHPLARAGLAGGPQRQYVRADQPDHGPPCRRRFRRPAGTGARCRPGRRRAGIDFTERGWREF